MFSRALQADALDSLLIIANTRIANLRSDYDKLQSVDSSIMANYAKQLNIAEEEKKILLQAIADKNKEIRREKRKRFWTGAAGVVATGAAIYISTLK